MIMLRNSTTILAVFVTGLITTTAGAPVFPSEVSGPVPLHAMPLMAPSLSASPNVGSPGAEITNAELTHVAPLDESAREPSRATRVWHRTVEVDGLTIFYREAGSPEAPTLLLLHGFPTSSHMFRNLIPALADQYHLVAPDFPGYGNSSMPAVTDFDYTFDRLAAVIGKFTTALGLDSYSLYLMDYGAPVGFRLATAHPERVETLIVQNGNAYDEGLDNDFWEPIKAYWKDRGAINQGLDNPFWKNVKAAYQEPEMANESALRFLVTLGATQWQYTNGVRNKEAVSPDNWHVTQRLLDRPGNDAIQLQLFYDYGSNPPLYPKWQAYMRKHQPPTLIVWGANDEIFPVAGAHPYKRDLRNLEFHLLDTGHFALEEDGEVIAEHMRRFLAKNLDGGVTRAEPAVSQAKEVRE